MIDQQRPDESTPARVVPDSTDTRDAAAGSATSELPELAALIERNDSDAAAAWVEQAEPMDIAHEVAQLDSAERESLLRMLTPSDAADVIEQLPESQVVEAIENLDAATAARIIEELPSDEQADLLSEVSAAEAEAILEALDQDDADSVRRLTSYDDDVAGGLMITEFLAYTERTVVREVFDDLETNADAYRDYNIQYVYVTDSVGTLVGVVPMRTMMLAPRGRTLEAIMIREIVSVVDTAELDELNAVFRDVPFVGLPVVNAHGAIVGVLERSGVEHAMVEDADEMYRQSLGIVGGEELRSMPLAVRARRRLAWLSINILLNILAASVIAMHQDTLEAVIALAVFLPIISDMSGCSGNQAVAVSMRELTLGVTRPRDVSRVLIKELTVGVCNGIILGLLIGGVAYAWKGNVYLGIVVGAALMINTVVAVLIGGAVPLLLKSLKMDPALASGPILTTMTDMCGFLLVLSLAALMLSHLTVM
ncbi:MAG: magnesium transporter [Phycisphaerales bacterium]|nr:magnesium transporter [Phycisphaerales bacterium]